MRSITRTRWIEIIALLAIISVALLFRLWQLGSVPPGLHYDEAIDLRWGHNIVTGARPIYVTEGWGREALYYYLVAAVLQVVPDNVLALRVTAVLCSLGAMLATYVLVRRVTNPLTAWFTVAWSSVIFWAVFTSRFAVRDIALLLLFNLTLSAFWYAFLASRPSPLYYLPVGILLGLTLYTYQPARFAPILFILFCLYLFLFHRHQWRQQAWGLVLFGGVALLVALPLISTVMNNPVGEAERLWTIEPLTQLLQGNLQPVWQNGIATLKMFTMSGDPLNSYNVPNRPVFQPVWTGLFFYLGLLIALRRWWQPFYAFLLIWLFVMLSPTVLTISAPNFNRTLAAQTAVCLLAALPIAELRQWLITRKYERLAFLPIVMGFLALGITAVATWHDYFQTWPQIDEVAVQYNAPINDIAHYIKEHPDPTPLLINSRSLEDADPYILNVSLDQPNLNVRWADTGQAFVRPDGAHDLRLFVATGRWVDNDLSAFVNLPPATANEARFAVFDLSIEDWLPETAVPVRVIPFGGSVVGATAVAPLPLTFQNKVQLTGIHQLETTLQPSQTLTFFTTWQVQQKGDPIPLAIFMHLLDANEQIISQQDGLGFPPHSWQPGDQFIHVHHLSIPDDSPLGTYWLQFGLYNRDTGERWPLWDAAQTPLGDRVLLEPLTVK